MLDSKLLNFKTIGKDYLSRGFSIIPVGPEKKPLINWKIYQSRHPSELEVNGWLYLPNFAGFGIVTGDISDLLVLDLDPGSSYPAKDLPLTPTVITGRDGRHFYFRLPKNVAIKNTTGLYPHTDIRANGGYVVAPPAVHPNGNVYRWLYGLETPIVEVPENLLLDLSSPKLTTPSNLQDGKVAEGQRNSRATSFLGKLLHQITQDKWDLEAWDQLVNWNNEKCRPPLETSELRSIFNSICSREASRVVSAENQNGNHRESQADKLVKLVQSEEIVFVRDEYQKTFIVQPDCKFVASPITSSFCKSLLSRLFWEKFEKVINTSSLNSAISVLDGMAQHSSLPITQIHNRIANCNRTLYYDLGDNKNVVAINETGWQVTPDCPVVFRRFSHQQVQVFPIKGNVRDLLPFFNLKDESYQLLLLTYLAASFVPDIPRSMLLVQGDQGSAKSTALKLVRSLIDPSQVPLVGGPKNIAELIQQASHNYALYFDNLSDLNGDTSDTLCRLVTGEGFSKRELYTNDDDVHYSCLRLIGIAGITQVATKADLLDRSLIINLIRIPDEDRIGEKELWKKFNKLKPSIFGGLLDLVVLMLQREPLLKVKNLPRMADYFRYCLAAGQALEYSESYVRESFYGNSKAQNREALEASAVGQCILKLMDNRQLWSGSSTSLFDDLRQIADQLKLLNSFVKSSHWLWRKIAEIRPSLIAEQITVEKKEKNVGTEIIITNKNVATTATYCHTNSSQNSSSGNSGDKELEENAMEIFGGKK